jgi:GNAT superfamily N-acetyltransferase
MTKTLLAYQGHNRSKRPSMAWAIPLVLMMVATGLFGPWVSVVAAEGPKKGTYFDYDYKQNVDGGTGIYDSWTDSTTGRGHYKTLSRGANEVQMSASYYYDYSDYDGKKEHTSNKVTFSFNLSDRHYTSPTIELDDEEYIYQDPHTLCIWLYVPPSISTGERICILDAEWVVTSTNAKIWSKYVAKQNLIEVTERGSGNRNDDYGSMSTTYTDKLYFDKTSGMFVAERYEEKDTGSWKGQPGGFNYHVAIDVTSSSYEFQTDYLTMGSIVLTVVLVLLGVCYLIYRIRWRSRFVMVRDLFSVGLSRVRVKRIWKAKQFPRLQNNATDHFQAFMIHWVEKALVSKDRVAVAIDSQWGIVGVAFYVKEGKIGTILCKHTELTEVLRGFIGCKDFFTEMQHSIAVTGDMQSDPYIMAQINKFGTQAFNVFETYNVYKLPEIRPTSYDADLVRPMTEQDILPVAELAQKVYRCKAKRWIRGNIASGDMGVVAVVDGKIVGFGFACMCGQYGRLHTLGVDPAYRGRGIAKELHRARLEAMRLMGVTSVIDEIADWNLPSIRISSLSGFQPIGKMYVETTRKKRIKKDIVRR